MYYNITCRNSSVEKGAELGIENLRLFFWLLSCSTSFFFKGAISAESVFFMFNEVPKVFFCIVRDDFRFCNYNFCKKTSM